MQNVKKKSGNQRFVRAARAVFIATYIRSQPLIVMVRKAEDGRMECAAAQMAEPAVCFLLLRTADLPWPIVYC